MKLHTVFAVVAGLLTATPAAFAHDGHGGAHGKGVVNSVDAASHKINMSHDAISTLGWPAMKMDFAVAPSVDLKTLQPGTAVEFSLEKTKSGAFEIQSIKPAAAK